MSHETQCPKCGQSKFEVVDNARCIVCDNVISLEDRCKHREDGQVKCTTCDKGEKCKTCDEPGHPSFNLDDTDFEGRKQ